MIPQKTTIDWLRFRAREEPQDILNALAPMYGLPAHSDGFYLESLGKGVLGFRNGSLIKYLGLPVGRMDFGGESQRGWVRVDLTGTGCEWVKDWEALEDVESLEGSEPRRVDLALTTWDGEVTHDQVVQAHTDDRFVTRGRPPVLRTITSSDPKAGRTCYIGKRTSDKFMRCYEKGFELAGKYAARSPGEVTHIDGKAVEDIYRCEVEFKASGTTIPWEIIERRDQYFAGAYPFCADILPGIEADILMRRPERNSQISMMAALDHLKIQFGPTLFTALHAYHGDMTAVWDKIIGEKHNETLVAAGVLLVEHE